MSNAKTNDQKSTDKFFAGLVVAFIVCMAVFSVVVVVGLVF